jgi:hypothetical protein
MNIDDTRKGYIAILAVIIIAVAGLALATMVSLIGLGELQSSLSLSNGESTLHFVESCAEDALLKSRDYYYAGGNITRPEGTCTVSVAKNGTTWTITASTAATNYVRTVQVVIVRGTASMTISRWREI